MLARGRKHARVDAVRRLDEMEVESWFGRRQQQLGGGFNDFLFSPLFGEDFQFD